LGKEIWKTKKTKKEAPKDPALAGPTGQALILGLEGDLGGGKTTFLQGLAKGLGIKQRITSPTFVILKKFQVKGSKFKAFCHIDCYRLKKPKEILVLGFKEMTANPENIVAVEWAGRIQKILPRNTLMLKFEFISRTKRRIRFNPMR